LTIEPANSKQSPHRTEHAPRLSAFYEALKAAGIKPEVHIYSDGHHGFGMKKQGTTSDHWIEEFYYWLESQGLTKPPSK
jgi:acetyl esterase/lipase